MVREGEYIVDNTKYKKLVFYDIQTGDIEEVFNSIPAKRISYNNRDFLYAQFNMRELFICIWDMVTRQETEFKINSLISTKCQLLRIDRAEKNTCNYYISIYDKTTLILHNYQVKSNALVRTWNYTDWIPNIKRVTFRGPTAYVILSTISVYDMDKREIICADKRKVWNSLLNFEEEYTEIMESNREDSVSESGEMQENCSETDSCSSLTEIRKKHLTGEELDLEIMRVVFYRLL